MGLSTGYKKIRTAVFISGTGSNLKSLIKFSKTNKSPISIDFIISNTCIKNYTYNSFSATLASHFIIISSVVPIRVYFCKA